MTSQGLTLASGSLNAQMANSSSSSLAAGAVTCVSSGSALIGAFFSLLWDSIFLPRGFYWMPDIVRLTALDIGHFVFLEVFSSWPWAAG